ncbi:MAG TPA: tripartite tricarboxylate transporter substrate binding protein [Paracoccus sp. (in: a-proteobacteria)]|uniref:Bug family tripartite tricarboxylate transporter substrate binding protein n=1 Tax=Paracoccus sp. TaxID=267 RepID=UPI002C9D0B2C|nr:tripartite tricarboxylate transporter substrate binding protein [Paracoccus sp. (in: a-proteobacteria)]HWL58959.1 tripartite tricarboxylate transporter substrate binding protein [Paracoccus sp. (in: a-proteobacteria)]
MKLMKASLLGLSVALGLAGGAARADIASQSTIQIVVPFNPGGSTDPFVRFLADEMQQKLGKPVIVMNKPGAGGVVGTAEVARGPGDGSTLLFSSSSFLTGPAANPNAGFDPVKDFKTISVMGFNEFMVIGAPKAGISSLEDLLAKAKVGKVVMSTAGVGSSTHFVGTLVSNELGLKPRVLHMKSSGEAMLEVIAGRADYYVGSVGSSAPYLKDEQGKGILYLGEGRRPEFPDVPAAAEKGYPEVEAAQWFGFFAPAGVSDADVATLNRMTAEIMQSDKGKAFAVDQGVRFEDWDATKFQAYMADEYGKWQALVESGME